ncbi:ribosomal protein L7Ae/L30e/S12e/Gadd45 family protein [Artemisia annua]|uniref:Ribosomal protein L7Ae/L30e/S12e/Gadd45 family protein n=1 Tax=Artemisia annua TaxID=35608 RepID=A0A2U1NUD9_ARTAN|nr:ribosomal protein L7Ae/L30e/S12e/Gadd45 family protein [Artemisia annua]
MALRADCAELAMIPPLFTVIRHRRPPHLHDEKFATKKKTEKAVNPLFEKRPKQFGISIALPPNKDVHRSRMRGAVAGPTQEGGTPLDELICPSVKRGHISADEEDLINLIHLLLGNSLIGNVTLILQRLSDYTN